MMRRILYFLTFLAMPSIADDKEVKLLGFASDLIEVCDGAMNCSDVDRDQLPAEEQLPLPVMSFDEPTGMLMVKVAGRELWIHQSEVELNIQAMPSVICADRKLSKQSDENTYATMGLGEGCSK